MCSCERFGGGDEYLMKSVVAELLYHQFPIRYYDKITCCHNYLGTLCQMPQN